MHDKACWLPVDLSSLSPANTENWSPAKEGASLISHSWAGDIRETREIGDQIILIVFISRRRSVFCQAVIYIYRVKIKLDWEWRVRVPIPWNTNRIFISPFEFYNVANTKLFISFGTIIYSESILLRMRTDVITCHLIQNIFLSIYYFHFTFHYLIFQTETSHILRSSC